MTDLPPVAAPPRPPATVRVTAWVALAGLVVAALGIVVLLRPLRTPIQDCGTAAGFLLDGRVDLVANPDDPPPGTTRADVLDNNAERCQERAANRARSAIVVVVVGALIGLTAVLVEAVVRWRWRSAIRRSYLAGTAPPSDEAAPATMSDPGDPSDPSDPT